MIAMPKYADSLKKPEDLLQVISDQQNVVLITSEMSAQIVSEFYLETYSYSPGKKDTNPYNICTMEMRSL